MCKCKFPFGCGFRILEATHPGTTQPARIASNRSLPSHAGRAARCSALQNLLCALPGRYLRASGQVLPAVTGAISRASTLPLSYITQRKAFAFLIPKSMVRRRRRRRVEVEKEVANIFEVQMRVRMRRQSVKQGELRIPRSVDDYSATLDLRESSENVDDGRSNAANGAQRSRMGKGNEVQPRRWVPHPIQEEVPSPPSSVGSEVPLIDDVEEIKDEDDRPTEYAVTRVRQKLARDAMFRLEQLGDFDIAKSVPSYSYRDSNERVSKHWSVDTTEGSLGVYRLPRLLHNSRVNLPPRPPQYYM